MHADLDKSVPLGKENFFFMKKYIILTLSVVLSLPLLAVPADPTPFAYTLEDGSTVMAIRHGDEFHSYITTVDGRLLKGSLSHEVTDRAARMRKARNSAGVLTYPVTGEPRSLVILVGFKDLPFAQKQSDFQDLLTKSGYNYNGATGSCRDYYIASSDSIFRPQFDCYGPYTLSEDMAYYGANTTTSNSEHAAQMVAEACQMAHDAGVNFKDYDTNNDGLVDNVFVFYAGHNEAEGGGENTIWPHASNISYLGVKLDGVTVSSYSCTSEYKGSNGSTRCGIGTFCHEFGHVIGQPDFYDTDDHYYTVADWDIMSSGSYNNNGNTPPLFSAYERMYEGWLTPEQLELPGTYMLQDQVNNKKQAYLIAADKHNMSNTSPSPSEFFILEYRSAENVWDAHLPGSGMLVWHIDFLGSAWTNNTPNNGPTLMRMHLEEANGVSWKNRTRNESGRASDPYPGTQNVTSFTPVLHNGTVLDQPIFEIEENNNAVTFTYISKGSVTLKTSVKELHLTTTVSDNKKVVDWEPKSFELIGSSLNPDEQITISGNSNFVLYEGNNPPARTDSQWKTSLQLSPESDSTIQKNIYVSYRPKAQSCEATTFSLSIKSNSASLVLPLYGYSPRPTYVYTPEVYEPEVITPYSFAASWEEIEDALLYYLTLYQVSEGTTSFLQNFENFSDAEKVLMSGWQTNTYLTTTSAKADGNRALYMKNHGDQITSETYPSPITNLSFWYNAFAATIDTVGILQIEAYDGEDWNMIELLVVKKTSKSQTFSRDFNIDKNYVSFRLTWLDNGGAGLAVDAFKATSSQKIDYIYKGDQLALTNYYSGAIPSYTFNNLNPNSTYYWQVQCTDLDKGCEEHLTDLSAPIAVTTLAGEPIDSKKLTICYDSINYNPATLAIYLTNPEKGDYLYFYNTSGNLVHRITVIQGVYSYELPLSKFRKGEIYMVQHGKDGGIGRKNKRTKFIY